MYNDLSESKLEDLLIFWLDEKKFDISNSTYYNYSKIIQNHLIPSLGNIQIKDISDSDIEVYLIEKAERGFSNKTIKTHYQILKQVLEKAVSLKLIKYNPGNFVNPSKIKKSKKYSLSKKEINKLLAVAKEYDEWIYNFIVVTLSTGMRRNESLGITWNDIDFENKTIHLTHKLNYISGQGISLITLSDHIQRKIFINKKVVNILKHIKNEQLTLKYLLKSKYQNKYNLVFCKDHGDIYHPASVTRKFNQIVSIASLSDEISIHTLRNTYTTHLFENKVSPRNIKDQLGMNIFNRSFLTE
ncbi:MAG: tyrosine-type recombinase/integrase [Bacillota bacterium]